MISWPIQWALQLIDISALPWSLPSSRSKTNIHCLISLCLLLESQHIVSFIRRLTAAAAAAAKSLSHVWVLVTPWTAAYQAPPSMGFSRLEYWSGVPLPSLWGSLCPAYFTPPCLAIFSAYETWFLEAPISTQSHHFYEKGDNGRSLLFLFFFLIYLFLGVLGLGCNARFSLVVLRKGNCRVVVRGLLIVVTSLVVKH